MPPEFTYDEKFEWLEALGFAEDERALAEADREQSEERTRQEQSARELGFADQRTLERARKFAALPQSVQERVLDEIEKRTATDLPNHEPGNPERRAEKVRQEAAEAPERVVEPRTRAVSVGREEVKQETAEYLREQYTNKDGEMICQICKAPLPFKLADDSYYFEKVEFLEDLKRRHHQNYLALCPNHAAMYQHANDVRDQLRRLFDEQVGPQLPVTLANTEATIYFTKTHIADLKEVIQVDSVH